MFIRICKMLFVSLIFIHSLVEYGETEGNEGAEAEENVWN